MEKWKQVIGFEGLYEVSNLGNCRRLSRGKKLTAEQVDKAKALFAAGGTLKAVGKEIGVSVTTAFQIRKGNTWKGDSRYRPVAAQIRSDFYLEFWLSKAGKPKRFPAHRLIWETFNGPIPYRLQVNHKNLDRADNRLWNLELVTASENINHAINIYRKEGKCHNEGGRYYDLKKSKALCKNH